MRKRNVVAILCSDIHLSHKCPVARSAEPDWYMAMKRHLIQLSDLSVKYNAPIICAGDVFDRWNSPPELINFAIDNLPDMYAIPGQHDLPNHVLEDVHKSAYWTLVEQGTLVDLNISLMINDDLYLFPFPWGTDIKPPDAGTLSKIKLAVIHKYCWMQGSSFPGAEEGHISAYRKQLKGYDAAVFGDNHKGFISGKVCNCGSLIRRSIDQIDYKPFVGLLHVDGSLSQEFLDISEDLFLETKEVKEIEIEGITKFVEELNSLGPDSLDFETALNQYMENNRICDDTRSTVSQILEESK
jgi:hypothetical protein